MNELAPIRQIFYDILTSESDQPSDVNALQQMGVSLSHAARKNGVNIVQLQNVVSKQIVHKVTEGLRLLDDLDHRLPEPVNRDEPDQQDVMVERLRDYLRQGSSLAEFLAIMEKAYITIAVDEYGRETAARRLRVRTKRITKAGE